MTSASAVELLFIYVQHKQHGAREKRSHLLFSWTKAKSSISNASLPAITGLTFRRQKEKKRIEIFIRNVFYSNGETTKGINKIPLLYAPINFV
jgi:hypothetical protein